MTKRETVFSYGGGVQSIAISLMIIRKFLPKPDHIIFADTGREASETMEYYEKNLRELFDRSDMKLEIARRELSRVDLFGLNGDLLIPAYTKNGKLPTFCSSEWKKLVIRRYMREIGISECDMWIGFSLDEFERMKDSGVKWITNKYPLIERRIKRSDCYRMIVGGKLPEPSRSSCYMCPHRKNEEWLRLKNKYPEDWKKAVEVERTMQLWDPEVYLHEQKVPLSEVVLDAGNKQGELFGCLETSCFT